MMRLSLILSIIVASASAYEVVEPREGKCVARSEPDATFKLGKKNQDATSCANKCLADSQCLAMQFEEPRTCSLYYTQVKKVNTYK